jgi:hypothetical protein
MKKPVQIAIVIVSILIFISGFFVVADYFSLFGTKVEVKLEFIEVRIRTLNADTGGLIMNVGVRCLQKHNENACTRKDSHRVGIVSVNVPIRRVTKKTLLFQKAEEIIKTADPKIHIMLINQNYVNTTKTFLMEDLYTNKKHEYVMEMPPIDWGDSEEETNE